MPVFTSCYTSNQCSRSRSVTFTQATIAYTLIRCLYWFWRFVPGSIAWASSVPSSFAWASDLRALPWLTGKVSSFLSVVAVLHCRARRATRTGVTQGVIPPTLKIVLVVAAVDRPGLLGTESMRYSQDQRVQTPFLSVAAWCCRARRAARAGVVCSCRRG
jgi:hypothetical protein